VILRPVKAMLFQYGLIAQRDPWIHGSVAIAGRRCRRSELPEGIRLSPCRTCAR
jgi:hypothetical protein